MSEVTKSHHWPLAYLLLQFLSFQEHKRYFATTVGDGGGSAFE